MARHIGLFVEGLRKPLGSWRLGAEVGGIEDGVCCLADGTGHRGEWFGQMPGGSTKHLE